MKSKKKPELLAPAGNFKSLAAAIKAGADAVYFGLKDFNMRDSAQNFRIKDLKEINKMCGKNIKKYLTLNTIIYNNELLQIEKVIKQVKGKVDAIICWDISVINLCKKYKIPFFISTQASVSNKEAAKFYKKLGASRIILARELNLNQIKQISKILPVEIFIHGAMCVAESGRCFTSQFLHCKSANRGQCQHPCRKTYKIIDDEGNELKLENHNVMSAKDLCTLPFFEKIKKSGAISFKIEGRGREPEYVYTITKIYRKALDNKFSKKEIANSMEELKQVYNRDFSSGYFIKSPTPDDFTSSENGNAKKTKKYVGKVSHYWKEIGVAAIKVSAEIKQNDDLLIVGKNTYQEAKVKSMQINHKEIQKAEKGQDVAIKLPLCRENDEVYVRISKNP